MNYSPRIKRLGISLGLLGLILFAAVIYRMIWQGESLGRKAYFDQPMADLVYALAEEGIIAPEGEGVKIDMERLRSRIPNAAARQFVVTRQRFMSFVEDSFEIDSAAFKVTNRRLIRQAVALHRGRILDRTGKILAETIKTQDDHFRRNYPLGPAALPLIGVAHPVYGLKGLERYLSPYLQGETNEGLLNHLYRFFSGKQKLYDAVLTIDSQVQKTAFEALGDRTGAVVVLEAATGDVLAAASTPSFDPATPAGEVWDHAAKKGYVGPFVNRALHRRYPPGSTFKLLVSAAWLEQSDHDPKWGIDCRGRHPRYRIKEYKGKHHGWASLKTAVTLSCNVFFAEAGARLSANLGDYANRFGFNRIWPLVDENNGGGIILPSRAFEGSPAVRSGRAWEPIDYKRNPKLLAQAGVGQNVIEATPLQMAMVAAALANGGELMRPRLIKQIDYVSETGEGDPGWFAYLSTDPVAAGRVCRKETAEEVIAMMAAVMDKGTGYSLKKIYFREGEYKLGYKLPPGSTSLLAGKTGTAETAKGKADHSWFVAAAPVDNPRFAVAVMVEHGGLGARTAGPIAVDVMLKTLNVMRD